MPIDVMRVHQVAPRADDLDRAIAFYRGRLH
jgi:catechol 2,3-dioxygenase-like lactoylglutathione lyase family enzyme